MKHYLSLAVLLLLIAVPGHGQSALKRVAVLEFGNRDLAVTNSQADYFANLVRDVARPILPVDAFLLITRESMEEHLPAGMTLRQCTDSVCELEVGRKLGADFIFTGSITKLDDELRLTARIYDVLTGNVLRSQVIQATNIKELESELRRVSAILLAAIPGAVVAQPDRGGGVVFVKPTQPGAPQGEAGVREIAPTEAPPPTATGPAGLYITSNPPGADVYLGSTKAGNTSPAFQMPNLQSGTRVRVTLTLDLYHDVSFDVDLKPGITRFENVELSPAFGSLNIESDPPGANVLIGGVEVGTTPYTNPRYPSGDYLVGVELDQYVSVTGQTISVRDGETTTKTFTLSANFGMLSVESVPPGAVVSLDGNRLGTTPGSWRVVPVANGTVELSLPGYRSRNFALTIDRGQRVTIPATQATLTRKVGALQVFADPPDPGAKVFLDGREVGAAPLTLDNISEGRHEVKVETPGKSGTVTVAVTEGRTVVTTVALGNAGAAGMVELPGGWFTMGCVPGDTACDNDEKPAKRVHLIPFWLDVHEVTVAEYKACVQARKCQAPTASTGSGVSYNNWGRPDREDHPINGVDWYDANTYCQWQKKHLPTEAEIEFALRGGQEGNQYPWGNSSTPPDHYGNYLDESAARQNSDWAVITGYDDDFFGTSPVCSMKRNPYGLCDISGNVWEWSSDSYYTGDQVAQRSNIDRANDASSGRYYVIRGGGWFSSSRKLRASYREKYTPSYGNVTLGFRCSR